MSKDSGRERENSTGCPACRAAQEEDHRAIGERLEIFDFSPLVGPGMPLWLENGHTLRELIKSYVNSVQRRHGIGMVTTPALGRRELYQTSGHWDHYRENIFPPMELDQGDDYVLRPMTCPHHILLYGRTNRHERHLPLAYGENSQLYRYESSGGLIGLERTRCMELIDTHIFCSPATLSQSLKMALDIIREVAEAFGIEYEGVVLALRDRTKDKFFDDDELWSTTEGMLRSFMEENGLEFEVGEGDAAFYGPKIDFQINTKMGRTITLSTIQLDFLLPRKFGLTYLKGEGGERGTPIMIHLGIIGTLERFAAHLLERDGGWLPFWLSPVQIAVVPIDPRRHLDCANRVRNLLVEMGVRARVEAGDESLSRRMARIIKERVYGHMVIGDREMAAAEELVRSYGNSGARGMEGWSRVAPMMRRCRGDRSPISGGETHPKNHPDLAKWAAPER